mgnify:CR=1 FL=1
MAFTEPSALERLKYMQDAKTVAIVGASLTAVTLTVDVTDELLASPSLRTQVIVRALVLGFSDVLL